MSPFSRASDVTFSSMKSFTTVLSSLSLSLSLNVSPTTSNHPKKKKKIALRVEDHKLIKVDESVAMEFKADRSFLKDDAVSPDTIVPLPNVKVKARGDSSLKDLILAANVLNVKPLMGVSDRERGRSHQEPECRVDSRAFRYQERFIIIGGGNASPESYLGLSRCGR
ncbi:hypothetical protein FEM48_Zijuj05G0033700 [Ziziphus jujuba var. spinosa]|uniref:Uncharacterized protein n=1 Tax=Ziziphus jujuba var. spinosa TaxID=714518 RepID=A0A978VCJ1_ZIZJJ|nr:hypothetical protein FEM48_Zijuj05G0033700 [Ziziphus jujuba var. spinosa]